MSACSSSSGEPINQYAVVTYIPDQLGDFITRLRRELVNGCVARSHVSILPPRALSTGPENAERMLAENTPKFSSFLIDIPRIRVFRETSVIFADIGQGREAFFEMHDTLNAGPLAYDEPYAYHPHITLAQGFDPATLSERYELALSRWKELAPSRPVPIENLTFVQNTDCNSWLDLVEYDLRGAMASSR